MSSSFSNESPAGDDSGFESEDQHHLNLDDGKERRHPLRVVNGKLISSKRDVEALRQRLKTLKASTEADETEDSTNDLEHAVIDEDDTQSTNLQTAAPRTPKSKLEEQDYFSLEPNPPATPNGHVIARNSVSAEQSSTSGLPRLRHSSGIFSSRKSSLAALSTQHSKSPSWSHLDRMLSNNDLTIYNTTESKRRRRLTVDNKQQQPGNVRELGVPVKFDVHLKVLINSRPLFACDWDQESETVRARRLSLESYKYTEYSALEGFLHAHCNDMWTEAKEAVEGRNINPDEASESPEAPEKINKSVYVKSQDGKYQWKGPKDLDLTGDRAFLKLEEDGLSADLTLGRTIICGDEVNTLKEFRYKEWWKRIVDGGVLARYCVEFTVDLVLKG